MQRKEGLDLLHQCKPELIWTDNDSLWIIIQDEVPSLLIILEGI